MLLGNQLPNNTKCPRMAGGTQHYLEAILPTEKKQPLQSLYKNEVWQETVLLSIYEDKPPLFKNCHSSTYFG